MDVVFSGMVPSVLALIRLWSSRFSRNAIPEAEIRIHVRHVWNAAGWQAPNINQNVID